MSHATPSNTPSSVPASTARSLIKLLASRGLTPEQVVRQLDLPDGLLDPVPTVGTLDVMAYSRLYRFTMEVLQDESFGLNFSGRMPPGTFRMLCLFVIHCSTLKQVIQRSRDFFAFCHRLAGQPLDRLTPLQSGAPGETDIVFEHTRTRGEPPDNRAQASVIFMMRNFYSWLIGHPLTVRAFYLTGPAPPQPEGYREWLGAPVHFNQAFQGMRVDSALLEAPVVQTEETLKGFLRTAPYHLVNQPVGQEPAGLREQIAVRIRQQLNKEATRLSDIAVDMGVTTRTLHRRLAAENTSFRAIKDSVLRQTAEHYIGNTELSVDAIAALMGFKETTAFYRSFRRWFGQSPGRYRQRLHAS